MAESQCSPTEMKPILLLLSVLGFCIAAKGLDEFTTSLVKLQASFLHMIQWKKLMNSQDEMRSHLESSQKAVDDHSKQADHVNVVPPLKLNSRWRLGRYNPMSKLRWRKNKGNALRDGAGQKVKGARPARVKLNYVNPMYYIRRMRNNGSFSPGKSSTPAAT